MAAKIKSVGKSKRVIACKSESIAAAVPLDGKRTEYRIEGERGLVLVVTKEGTGSYYFRYVVGKGQNRKFRWELIGRRDEVRLADAKDKAAELRLAVGRGADPVAEAAASAGATTLRELFTERMAKDTKSERTLYDYRRSLEHDVFPELGDLPADEITGEQIARVLEAIESRSKHAAHKARSAIGSTYRWAMKRRKVRSNPTIGLGFTVQSSPRNRVLDDDDLKTLWAAIDHGPGLSEAMRLIMKLAILTGQRESEVAGALAAELTLGTANAKWKIPSPRMKRKSREQIVPLSSQAVALFKRAIELSNGSPYVFPADTSRVRIGHEPRKPHINGESVSRAMARLRDRPVFEARKALDAAERALAKARKAGDSDAVREAAARLTAAKAAYGNAKPILNGAVVHDFRKTITTWLRENRLVSSDVCDLILHHSRKGVTSTHYDFSTLEGPVRKAYQDWADHIDAIAAGKEEGGDNVHQLRPTGTLEVA